MIPLPVASDRLVELDSVQRQHDKAAARTRHPIDDGDRLDILSTLVASYEQRTFPMDPSEPVEAIKFRMDQQELKPKDLESMIGQRNKVYAVLNRKRPLTLAMVWRLHTGLGIPAESLIRQPV